MEVGKQGQGDISEASEQPNTKAKSQHDNSQRGKGNPGEVGAEGIHVNKRPSKGISMFQLYVFHLAPSKEHWPYLRRGCLFGVRLFRITMGGSVVDHIDFVPTTHFLGYDNLCTPGLSVAGTRTVIVRVHSKVVLICVLLNTLPVRCRGGVSCCCRRREGGNETRWQLCGVVGGIGHVRVVIRRLKTCTRCFEEERGLHNDRGGFCVRGGFSFSYSGAMFRGSRSFRAIG
jgi:hypothetical protein